TTEIYTLSLHDALPILKQAIENENVGVKHCWRRRRGAGSLPADHRKNRTASAFCQGAASVPRGPVGSDQTLPFSVPLDGQTDQRSEEHTSELQSRFDLV